MNANQLTVTLFALLPFTGCLVPDDEDDTGNQTSAGSESSGTAPSTSAPTTTAAESSGVGSVDSSGSESGGATSADSSGGETENPPPTNCVDATLLMGNPYFDGNLEGWNPDGQGMLDDPPLRSRHLAGLPDDRIAIETQFEVWGAEAGQLHRIAGMEDDPGDTRYSPNGACAEVRVLIAAGIAGLPDGRIVVADTRGNGLVELREPFGDCQGAVIAGNPDVTLDVDVGGTGTAAPGDVDGPGAMARFNGVERPVSDEDGNIYVIDTGNSKFKRIADDADRTVSTVFSYDDGLPMAMTAFGGTLYVSGTVAGEDFIWAIDVAGGTREVLYQGGDLFEELDTGADSIFFGMTNDGVDLLLASGQGYIVRVSTAGAPLGIVAGFGPVIDYPTDLDLSMPIPVAELPIRSYAIGLADLVRAGNDLLFTNNANGVGFHVWSIHCG
jgi:hypothetical protein